jgi:hypothetical protein
VSHVVKIIGGIPGLERYPELVEQIGRYLVRYEPEKARKGEQWIWTTGDIDEAHKFMDVGDWHDLYLHSVGTRPWDGKPDRPITVFHVTVMPFPTGKE